MKNYSKKYKKSLIAKMLPPNNADVPELSNETGIPVSTLYTWRTKNINMETKKTKPKNKITTLSGEDKLSIIVETASMNQSELSEYCRRKGFYPEQIEAWRKSFIQANQKGLNREDQKKINKQAEEIKRLEKELSRKEKALAETAALLVLKKKVQEIWGDPEEEK